MRYSTQIKPISFLKANAAEVLRELTERRRPLVITQNGEARAVMQDVASYEETQETLALLKILALGDRPGCASKGEARCRSGEAAARPEVGGLKRFEVLLTEDAERDLEDIYVYLAKLDSPKSAGRVLDCLLEVTGRLAAFPERGSQPKELRSVGAWEYRQALFGPFRIIYRVIGRKVVVYVVADGRRDMQALLERRLFAG